MNFYPPGIASDIDNDDDLDRCYQFTDIFWVEDPANKGAYESKQQVKFRVYRNDGTGYTQMSSNVSAISSNSPGFYNVSNLKEIDAGNDNVIDFLSIHSSSIHLSQNLGQNSSFQNTNLNLIGGPFKQGYKEIEVADVTNDGKDDIILVLNSGDIGIFINNGNQINSSGMQPITLPLGKFSSLAVGDINRDEKIDIVACSNNGSVSILKNVGGGSFQKIQDISGFGYYPNLGDMDYDGDLDLCFQSGDYSGVNLNVFKNNLGNFSYYTSTPIQNLSSIDWVDADGDGDLDVLVSDGYGYINNLGTNKYNTNTKPSSPKNLCSYFNGQQLTMSWSEATDAETQSSGLTYNLYVKQNGNFIMSPLANLNNGFRKILKRGNVDQNTSWTVQLSQSGGQIEWGVQAIDNQYLGSSFTTSSPRFSSPLVNGTSIICSGQSTAISQPGGFSWVVKSASSTISGAIAGSGANLEQVLTNSSNSEAGTVVYTITQAMGNCGVMDIY